MTLQTFTLSDTESGFYAEQLALVQKVTNYKEAAATLNEVIKDQTSYTDQLSRKEAILTAEVAKFQAELDCYEAKISLVNKIVDVLGIGYDEGQEDYVLAVPDPSNEISEVIVLYV